MPADFQHFLPMVFPRLLGIVYLIAFASLLVQVRGLYGARGVLPISAYLSDFRAALGMRAYRLCPTLLWLKSDDRTLVGGCGAGVLLSLFLIAGLPPVPLLLLLWLLYLSYASAGQDFLSFQWDALLLETGFMTIFLPIADPASPIVVFAYRFFLFRFIFSSGAVKLLSGDPTWHDLTALSYHFQTQPLPNRIAWYAHRMPAWALRAATAATLFVEIVVPFLCFGSSSVRLAGFFLLVLLQLLIFATGSYCYFNILTVLLTLPLLDDAQLAPHLHLAATVPNPAASQIASALFAIFAILNLCQLISLFIRLKPLRRLLAYLSPFMISNRYGLFAVMTTDRLEYEIQGSQDRVHWLSYEFRYKPGDPLRPPRQAAPHQPRLDWQMWFAALDPKSIEPWLGNLLVRLLEGVPEVEKLLEHNPFPEGPPAYVRLLIYRYRFATQAERRSEGRWWDRTQIGRSSALTARENGND